VTRLVRWLGWPEVVQLGWPDVVQPGPQSEVALFVQARGIFARPEVGSTGGAGVAGLSEQVGERPIGRHRRVSSETDGLGLGSRARLTQHVG
jgi:hypothetical protein